MPDGKQSDRVITDLLDRIGQRDDEARSALVRVVYNELAAMAGRRLRKERRDHGMQTTELVNEMYLRLFPSGATPHFVNRGHFYGAAARAMQQFLVDQARRRYAEKRQPEQSIATFNANCDRAPSKSDDPIDHIALKEACECLGHEDECALQVFERRFYGGQSIEDIAKDLNIPPDRAKRLQTKAKSYLGKRLSETKQ